MTKYTYASALRRPRPKKDVNPIWRGIGCLLILGVPVVSYFLAKATFQLAINQGWPMPYQLMGYPVIPAVLWSVVPGLVPILLFIHGQNNLYMVLLITILYIVFFGALLSLIYSIIYKIVGPPQYGPVDAPPPEINIKPYKR